jgi:GAF domain-containing protein
MVMRRDVDTLKSTLETGGAAAALAYLNAGVPHRYSAVYRLDGGRLKNVLLHDKAGEVCPEFLAEVPFETSFCQFVIRDGHFATSDSGADSRLDGHPYQGVMVSYHGVPILSGGNIWGTLCHFDVAAQPLPDDEFELLQKAAALSPGFAAPAPHVG